MATHARLARVLRLRTQLRELARDELGRRQVALRTLDARLEAARAEEDAARAGAGRAAADGVEARHLAPTWAYADAQARLAGTLAGDRACAAAAVTVARDEVRRTRRDEEQLARVVTRADERERTVVGRAAERLADELAIGRHGRQS